MGLFSRSKGRQEQPQPQPMPQPMPQQVQLGPGAPAAGGPPAPMGPSTPQIPRPPSFLSVNAPQPNPSVPQYHQQLFRQHYDYLTAHQPPDYGAQGQPGAATAAGTATVVGGPGGGDDVSRALLQQAVREAAKNGKPLTLNFVAQMQPVMANHPYGMQMPPGYDPNAPGGGVPPGWYPGMGQNPYDAIRIPALPDMRDLPAELQDFRDQCATGVRQAVAMITAMEHQLWWERSRRQQAEEDCKVLLGAVQLERGIGERLLSAEEQRRAEAAGAKLTLAADELPQASEAATTIQKHFRGRQARKEFESHLRDILRGVDPVLDPASLPVRAQEHISHVNATGAPKQLGLRALMDNVISRSGGGAGAGLPSEQIDATNYYRRKVDRIGQRLASYKDAGQPNPNDNSGDPLHADVKDLLTGSYPASSAQVIAALVRRCRELQAALLEAVGELEQAQLTIQGLKDANAKLSELSHVRADLEATRHDNARLAGTVAKLRTHLTATAIGANTSTARENPFVAAWYRKAYADQEWQRVPPGGPGGVALMDGPDTAVETWDDLRASIPEPIMVPRVTNPGTQYKDLLGLKQDMVVSSIQGGPDPLYSLPVPDRSNFMYERDTPLMPMQSPAPLIRESLAPGTFTGVHEDLYRRANRPPGPQPSGQYHPQWYGNASAAASSGGGGGGGGGNLLPSNAINLPNGRTPLPSHGGLPGSGGGGGMSNDSAYRQLLEQQERMRQQAAFEAGAGAAGPGGAAAGSTFSYNRDTPIVPVYSVLPLIREDEYVRRSMSPPREAPPPSTPQRQSSYNHQNPAQPSHSATPAAPLPPAEVVAAAAAAAMASVRPDMMPGASFLPNPVPSGYGSGMGPGQGPGTGQGIMPGPAGYGSAIGPGMSPGMGPGVNPGMGQGFGAAQGQGFTPPGGSGAQTPRRGMY